ncbi:MAG: PEP-CTERM sorting domain-containing protein [Candidatus Omnitrophica bacterium]|nr:PEP-CTERM sorting domain-containing protein [Candidatus Omnitrophota bacterium]
MKKLLLTLLIGLCVLGIASPAMAITILPGLSTGAAAPITTIAILELNNIPFASTNAQGQVLFTGVLTQKVYREATGLLFTYQFTNNGPATLSTMTTLDFAGWSLNVDATGAAGNWWLRNTDPTTVGFDTRTTGVASGATSDLFWIQTNAPSYTWGSTQLIDGGIATVKTYAPATPEPSSLMLLGMGILGLFGLGKRRKI